MLQPPLGLGIEGGGRMDRVEAGPSHVPLSLCSVQVGEGEAVEGVVVLVLPTQALQLLPPRLLLEHVGLADT